MSESTSTNPPGHLPPGNNVPAAEPDVVELVRRASESLGSIVEMLKAQDALEAEFEAGLTKEVRGLIAALRKFAAGTQLVCKSAPASADFSKDVALLLSLASMHFVDLLSQSLYDGVFADGGFGYLQQVGLGAQRLFRQLELDGRQFLAVALPDEQVGQFLDVADAGHEG